MSTLKHCINGVIVGFVLALGCVVVAYVLFYVCGGPIRGDGIALCGVALAPLAGLLGFVIGVVASVRASKSSLRDGGEVDHR